MNHLEYTRINKAHDKRVRMRSMYGQDVPFRNNNAVAFSVKRSEREEKRPHVEQLAIADHVQLKAVAVKVLCYVGQTHRPSRVSRIALSPRPTDFLFGLWACSRGHFQR